jgi:hypothetical protein
MENMRLLNAAYKTGLQHGSICSYMTSWPYTDS